MRIPSAAHLNRFCLTEHYRRCDLYRRFLGMLAEKPERWRVQGASRLAESTLAPVTSGAGTVPPGA